MFDTKLNELRNDGVSPVIGVILMVAITVILAAVIGTFVLGLADDLDQDAQAAVTFDEVEGSSVTVQVNSVQSADTIYVEDASGNRVELGAEVGNTVVAGSSGSLTYSSGGTLTVIGELDGSENVIQTYEMA